MDKTKDIIFVGNALSVGSVEWKCHHNLKVDFAVISSSDYVKIRRIFSVPSILRNNSRIMNTAANEGWSLFDPQIAKSISFECKKISQACKKLNVEHLLYTMPFSNKQTYIQLFLSQLIAGKYVTCEQILYDVKTNNRTSVYKFI